MELNGVEWSPIHLLTADLHPFPSPALPSILTRFLGLAADFWKPLLNKVSRLGFQSE